MLFVVELLLLHLVLQHRVIGMRVRYREWTRRSDLCEEGIVAETCAILNRDSARKGIGVYSMVSIGKLSSSLLISQNSIEHFLADASIEVIEDKVHCPSLCLGTVRSLPADEVPHRSDVACYRSGVNVTCDIDVSDNAMRDISNNDVTQYIHRRVPKEKRYFDHFVKSNVLEMLSNASVHSVQRTIANWFRIYPPPQATSACAFQPNPSSFIQALVNTSSPINCESDDMQKAGASARSYVTKAERELAQPESSAIVKRWFGADDADTVNTVRRVLKHIDTVLDNAVYTLTDHEEWFGWVSPPFLQDDNDAWPISIGKPYLNAPLHTKIGTLTHEATHFYPVGTYDHMYCNITGCQEFARERPEDAIANADHFAFFIDELNGGVMVEEYAAMETKKAPSKQNGDSESDVVSVDDDMEEVVSPDSDSDSASASDSD